jgi:hypothetical protein
LSQREESGGVTQLASQDVRFNFSGSHKNYQHLGLNKPYWDDFHKTPVKSDLQVGIYNVTGGNDDTRDAGSVMTSFFQRDEFELVATSGSTAIPATSTYQSSFLPNFPNLNCHNSLLIRSMTLRSNVVTTQTDHAQATLSNVIAKIPISVNQGQVINYEPQTPIRFNLGNAKEISQFDISITDMNRNLIDFNGAGHDISILFEVWNVVSIPLNRQETVSIPGSNNNSNNATDASFQQKMPISGRYTFQDLSANQRQAAFSRSSLAPSLGRPRITRPMSMMSQRQQNEGWL